MANRTETLFSFYFTLTIHPVGETLLSSFELSDGLPESLWSQPKLVLHGLNVPNLPWDVVVALTEERVEDLSDSFLCQMFLAYSHYTFGSTWSDRHPPPLFDPNHHQVVIS